MHSLPDQLGFFNRTFDKRMPTPAAKASRWMPHAIGESMCVTIDWIEPSIFLWSTINYYRSLLAITRQIVP